MSSRYFMIMQYNGKKYHGWQKQPNAPTIQSELNEKLSILLKEDIQTVGAGRTDKGVHAEYFVAHFDLKKNIGYSIESLVFKLNRFLPQDISIKQIVPVERNAHARYDAISRTYRYYISMVKKVFNYDLVWQILYTIDVELMNKGCEILKEYNDFTSFSKLGTSVKTNNCKILKAEWQVNNELLVFTITADRFLRNMVRAIVGTMINLGRHKINIDDFRRLIELKDRSLAGESAPSHGLFISEILYPYNL